MEKKKYDPHIHHRRSIRLKDYDYSQSGLYFITICTKDRLNLFGEIVGAGSKPALIDQSVCKRAGLEPAPTNMNDKNCTGNKMEKPIPEIVRQFKTFSARRINQLRNTPGVPVWQRNYYEHIIRNEDEYYKISDYIVNNPIKWQEDKYFA
jgi:putative transposase